MEQDRKDKLIQEILALEARAKRHAKNNHIAAYLVAAAATIGSILAAILAVADSNKWLVALAAIIPVAVTITNSNLKFEPRSNWFYLKKYRLAELRRKLEFEDADTNDISRELSELEKILQQSWVGFSYEINSNSDNEGT